MPAGGFVHSNVSFGRWLQAATKYNSTEITSISVLLLEPPTMIEDLWYKNAILYSLDLETFMDGNEDGIGDFIGLKERLDYLHALGVDAIWLAPFQPTPNRDNGYDILDYYGIDPRHGSGGDFVDFIHEARQRGIRVLIDLVVNHTSDEHPWFQESRRSTDSPRRDWYVWSKERPSDWDEGMVFPGVQESTWTKDPATDEYYFHRFFEHQPDLNLDHPEVRSEIRKITGYWLELGIAGFRLDALPFLIEQKLPGRDPKYQFEYLYDLRRFLQWRSRDAILLGEANVLPDEATNYFGKSAEGIHMMFNFHVNQRLFLALATGEIAELASAIEATRDLPPTAQWAHFLRNHDELDLERLSVDERETVFKHFGPDPDMQIFGRGIRRRLAPMLDGSRRRLELAHSLLLSLPGTPVLRYGEEIGMGDDLSLEGRASVRTPMQWCNEPQAGFSSASQLIHPVIADGPFAYSKINVEAKRRDPDSFLNWKTRMIRIRKECPEIGWGTFNVIPTSSPSVLALRFDWNGRSVLTLHNFADSPKSVSFNAGKDGNILINLLTNEDLSCPPASPQKVELAPSGYQWFRIGKGPFAALDNSSRALSIT